MRKAWLAAASMTAALATSGCVIVVGDDDASFKLNRDSRSADGYIVLNRDGGFSRLGGDINLRGRVGGDVSLISGDVDADDLDVGGDVSIAAGDINFAGRVDGEASVAGGDVDWAADVGDELSIAAGSLDVSGEIRGEASLAAGEMTLHADFRDGLKAAADQIELNGSVSGPLVLVAADEIKRNRRNDAEHGRIALDGRIADGGEVCGRTVEFGSDASISGQLLVWAESEPSYARGGQSSNVVFELRDGRDCDDLIDN